MIIEDADEPIGRGVDSENPRKVQAIKIPIGLIQ